MNKLQSQLAYFLCLVMETMFHLSDAESFKEKKFQTSLKLIYGQKHGDNRYLYARKVNFFLYSLQTSCTAQHVCYTVLLISANSSGNSSHIEPRRPLKSFSLGTLNVMACSFLVGSLDTKGRFTITSILNNKESTLLKWKMNVHYPFFCNRLYGKSMQKHARN